MIVGNVQNAAFVYANASTVRSAYAAQAVQKTAAGTQVQNQTQVQSQNQEPVDVQEEAQSIQANEEQADYITEKLNDIMRHIDVNLEFQYHKEVNFMSVRMLDKKTHEVLREIPSEDMVKHMIHVRDWIGAFLDKRA